MVILIFISLVIVILSFFWFLFFVCVWLKFVFNFLVPPHTFFFERTTKRNPSSLVPSPTAVLAWSPARLAGTQALELSSAFSESAGSYVGNRSRTQTSTFHCGMSVILTTTSQFSPFPFYLKAGKIDFLSARFTPQIPTTSGVDQAKTCSPKIQIQVCHIHGRGPNTLTIICCLSE